MFCRECTQPTVHRHTKLPLIQFRQSCELSHCQQMSFQNKQCFKFFDLLLCSIHHFIYMWLLAGKSGIALVVYVKVNVKSDIFSSLPHVASLCFSILTHSGSPRMQNIRAFHSNQIKTLIFCSFIYAQHHHQQIFCFQLFEYKATHIVLA